MMPAKTCVQRNSRLSHSLRVGSRFMCLVLGALFLCFVLERTFLFNKVLSTKYQVLTPAISRIAVRADQQRNVVMLGAVVDIEDDRDLRIEAVDAERREIRL